MTGRVGSTPYRDPAEWERAVALIRSRVSDEDRAALRDAMRHDLIAFTAEQHFSAGLTVRNLLRTNSFTAAALGATELDDAWAEVLWDAVAEDSGQS